MSVKQLLIEFSVVFAVTLVVSVAVTFLWNLVFSGAGAIDWETSFRFAIVLAVTVGVVLPWMRAWERRKNER